MKKLILAIFFLFTIINPVMADYEYVNPSEYVNPLAITVKDSYKFRTENRMNLSQKELLDCLLFMEYWRGFIAALTMEHGEKVGVLECLGKPLDLWFDIIFDEYKYGKFNGSEKFFSVFYGTVARICKITIAGK